MQALSPDVGFAFPVVEGGIMVTGPSGLLSKGSSSSPKELAPLLGFAKAWGKKTASSINRANMKVVRLHTIILEFPQCSMN